MNRVDIVVKVLGVVWKWYKKYRVGPVHESIERMRKEIEEIEAKSRKPVSTEGTTNEA